MRYFFAIFIVLTLLCSAYPAYAQQNEEITLTTYYPAPYGDYDELQTNRLAVGNNAHTSRVNGVVNFEGLTSDPAAADSGEGDIYYNLTNHEFRYQDNSGWQSFLSGSSIFIDSNMTRVACGSDYAPNPDFNIANQWHPISTVSFTDNKPARAVILKVTSTNIWVSIRPKGTNWGEYWHQARVLYHK